MTRPSLLIVSFSRLVSDPRVHKQVELFREQYDVSTCGMGPAPDGVVEHFTIPDEARGWSSDKLSLLLRRFSVAYEGMTAVHAARAILPVGTFDAILANDLNTLPLALSLNPRRGVHADLHEFAPREKEDVFTWRVFVAPFIRWLCRKYIPSVASATTVAEGIAREYEKDFGVHFDVVTNAAPYQDREPRPVGDRIRLFHSAAGQRYRRLEQIIDVMRDAPDNIELNMIVMPNEPDYVAELKEIGRNVSRLKFLDPVPYTELVNTVAEHDVAIAYLPPSNFNLANALPNKFFEAVQARVGLIIGPSPEMKRLLDEHSLGAVTDDFSGEALGRVISSLSAERVNDWKAAAHKAAHALSSEQQVQVWENAIHKLLTEKAS